MSPIAYPRVACEMDVRGLRIASAPASSRSVAECVSGVLTRRGAVLAEKRRADDEADPGLTLLPGGHVEIGESLHGRGGSVRGRPRRSTGNQASEILAMLLREGSCADSWVPGRLSRTWATA